MTEKFNPGDVVKLKSGGPQMTVESTQDNDNQQLVRCTWFEVRGRGATAKRSIEREEFSSVLLTHYKPARGVVIG